ncbi:S1 RNA-binding domain-containing protein [Oceanivirga salmonicida]|uniref:S1 RNA-binding domain-containing protein n=1 Tax=Oceanivirga salmonicida TaxID=1769291 RepID=UPI00082C580B|nr:S1 RNA-binding domain-containing protein [Oceanivirga salmonicida]
MSNVNFEELLAEYIPSDYKSGSVIEDAIIVRKDMDYGFLDINNKLEGRVRAFEIEGYEVGDKISVQFIRSEDDFIIVSKLALDRTKELDNYNESDVVSGEVVKKIKGGFNVRIKNNNAFLPFSLSAARGNEIVGKTFDFVIKEKSKKGLTVSRIDFVKEKTNKFLETVNVGDTLKGTVKEILDFGLILDLGAMTGLVHISELSWNQISNIRETYKVGQELEAKVIELNVEKSKIKLSVKQLEEDPWLKIREKYTIGEKRTGTIKEIFDFGLVINIDGTNDEGFMHISDVSYRKFFQLDKSYNVGDSIEFFIENINDEKQRISLSAKRVLDEKWENIESIMQEGNKIKAKIVFMQEYGMFVELENKLEAFVRRNEYAWLKEELPELHEGDEVDVVILSIDKEERKIAASIKELVVSPWLEAHEKYAIGDFADVVITNVLENAYLAELTPRFKGLIPKREATEELNVGDNVKVLVIDSNGSKSSIILSVKKVKEVEEKEELSELMETYGV